MTTLDTGPKNCTSMSCNSNQWDINKSHNPWHQNQKSWCTPNLLMYWFFQYTQMVLNCWVPPHHEKGQRPFEGNFGGLDEGQPSWTRWSQFQQWAWGQSESQKLCWSPHQLQKLSLDAPIVMLPVQWTKMKMQGNQSRDSWMIYYIYMHNNYMIFPQTQILTKQNTAITN